MSVDGPDLEGKVAVVTGSAGGFGLALARRFAREGASVVMADLDGPVLEEAAQTLRDEGADVLPVVTDVANPEDLDALAAATLSHFGSVYTICNNAGVVATGNTWELSLDDWRWVYDVNVWGIIHGIRAFVPHLVAAGEGHVINTVSNSALTTMQSLAPYVSSKHAALAITETLELDLRAIGSAVRVSAILPGAIRSRMPTAFRRRPARYGAPVAGVNVVLASSPPAPAADAPAASEREKRPAFGDPPDELVDRIWGDLQGEAFYVFTHEDNRAMATARAERIVAGRLDL